MNNTLILGYANGTTQSLQTGTTIAEHEYQGTYGDYTNAIVSVVVPPIVTGIGEYAFCDNALSSITLNEGLVEISNQAFQHGTYTAVTIPSTVTFIGTNAFNVNDEQDNDPFDLAMTFLGATPPTIDDWEGIIFGNPDYLSIYVPDESVALYKEEWPDYASKIYGGAPAPPIPPSEPITTSDIVSAYVGDTQVGRLYLGDELVWPSTLPAETRMVATYNVTSTTVSVRLMGQEVNYVTKAELEDGTVVEKTHTGGAWKYVFPSTGLQKVFYTIPQDTTISDFNECPQLVDIYIPENVTKIGMGCFDTCTGLTSVTIPDSVTAITDGSNFSYCGRLRTVEIGNGIKQMGDQVFMGCSVLTSITMTGMIPPTAKANILTGANNAVFYVPDSEVSLYKYAWRNYGDLATKVKGISERP